jgi:cytochrome c-type biogenesis protein CcmF
VLLTFTVLIGTIFPLVVEAINGKQMSVGRPYFDSMVVPVGAALLFLLGVGPALPWGRASREQLKRALLPPIAGAVLLSGLGFALGIRNSWTLVTLAFGGYAAQVTLGAMFLPAIQRMRRGEGIGSALIDGQLRRGRRRFASYVVHAGAVVVIIAIAVSSTMRSTAELSFEKGQTVEVSNTYSLTFLGVEERQEPHRTSIIARFAVLKGGRRVTTLEPRMNQYQMMREPIGTPDVHTTAAGDLYLSLLGIDPATQRASVTVVNTPLVMWIWVSVLLMGFGGLMALIPARHAIVTEERRPAASPDRVLSPAGDQAMPPEPV